MSDPCPDRYQVDREILVHYHLTSSTDKSHLNLTSLKRIEQTISSAVHFGDNDNNGSHIKTMEV